MQYYDIYMSIGPACRPAYHLKENGLRTMALPLDWQMAYSLDTVIHLFATAFDDFFTVIEELSEPGAGNNRRIKDNKNGIISMHHFSKDVPIKKAKLEFCEVMRKRYIKLNQVLMESKRIALVCNRVDELEVFKAFLISFSRIYPHLEIKLMNVRNDSSLESSVIKYTEYNITDKISIDEYTFNDCINIREGVSYDWKGNEKNWFYILKRYRVYKENDWIFEIENATVPIVVFGAGYIGKKVIRRLKRYEINVMGIAVSSMSGNLCEIDGVSVRTVNSYPKEVKIIIAIRNIEEMNRIEQYLKSEGYNDVVKLDFEVEDMI